MKNVLGIAAAISCLGSTATAYDVSGQAALRGKGWARDAVIYLQGDAKSTPLAHAVIDQRGKTFIPHVSVVTVGTKVDFPNNDTVFHNVFAYFEAQKLDLGMYPRGVSKAVTFSKAGYVSLLCNVHSEMSAYVVVVDTPYFAVTDAQGHFTIKDVPPGAYKLHAWHESGARFCEAVTIKPEGGPIKVELTRK